MKERLILFLLMIFPVLALADDTTLTTATSSLTFTPPASDYSVIFLSNLFGVVDGVLHGTGSQIMGAMFAVFNAAVLALGGIVVMYTVIVGTMNTAHEGQMLGQKWSSIWIPVRSTIGLSLLIPKASGYCLMQIFTMWVVVQGVGAADQIWNATLEYLNRGGAIVQAQMNNNSTTNDQDSAIIALTQGAGLILSGEVCLYGLQTLLENQRTSYQNSAQTSNSGPCSQASLANPNTSSDMVYFCNNSVPDFINTINVVDYQSKNAPDSAGVYTMPMPYFTTSPYSNLNGDCGNLKWNNFSALSSTTGTTLTQQDLETTNQSRVAALQQMYDDLSSMAMAMVKNDPEITTTSATQPYSAVAANQFGVPYLNSTPGYCSTPTTDCTNWGPDQNQSNQSLIFSGFELQNAVNDYNGIMLPALNLINEGIGSDSANKSREFIATAEQSGWIMAGSYFFNVAYLNGLVTSKYNTLDGSSGINTTTFESSSGTYPFVFQAPAAGTPCPTTATLCTFFNGDPGPVTSLTYLFDGSSLGITDTTGATTSSMTVSNTAAAYKNQFSSTVYGYVTNGAMVHLPGQPGLKTPQFPMTFNIQPGQTLLTFPSKHFRGFFGPIESALYNTMFRFIVDTIISFIVSVFNMAIQAYLQQPLTALMQIFQNGVNLLQTTMVHPIIALAYMGSAFINASVEIWLNLISFSIIFTVIGGPGWIIMLVMILPFLCSWMGVMTSVGFIDAYYAPFVPYMIFTFGSIAWLMTVIETTVAGPIIALGITHPEGHDALGKAEQAIMILVNVFLRPSMMIIGYVAAIALSYVVIFVLNSGFGNVMAFLLPSGGNQAFTTGGTQDMMTSLGTNLGQTGGSMSTPYYNWTAIYASFFCLVTYTSLYLTVVQKSFTLIALLPDKVLRWIGSQAESTGQETLQWSEDTKGQSKETADASGKSSMKIGGSVMGMAESAVVGASKGSTGGSMSAHE